MIINMKSINLEINYCFKIHNWFLGKKWCAIDPVNALWSRKQFLDTKFYLLVCNWIISCLNSFLGKKWCAIDPVNAHMIEETMFRYKIYSFYHIRKFFLIFHVNMIERYIYFYQCFFENRENNNAFCLRNWLNI